MLLLGLLYERSELLFEAVAKRLRTVFDFGKRRIF